jgi:hypothetical protein
MPFDGCEVTGSQRSWFLYFSYDKNQAIEPTLRNPTSSDRAYYLSRSNQKSAGNEAFGTTGDKPTRMRL